MLNQRLEIRGSVRFHWDNARGRVVRLESKIDFLTAMLRLLGGLADVARVFDRSLITLEGNLVAKDDDVSEHATKVTPLDVVNDS
ncbi:hypothetical protein GN244_ATG13417 [Phytophthora infestans]|uniref:Bzip transcription factor n=1 Tax=Phytophthora infestans TaxID=4787 RepID=A0A833SP68_PHYIN|nr:hypothetical protein GN244_ATG13417 [Phytophthora infestans]